MITTFLQTALPFAAVLLLALTMIVVTGATATQLPTGRDHDGRDHAHNGLPAGQLAPFLSEGAGNSAPVELQFDFNS